MCVFAPEKPGAEGYSSKLIGQPFSFAREKGRHKTISFCFEGKVFIYLYLAN